MTRPKLLELRNNELKKRGCLPVEYYYNPDMILADVNKMREGFSYSRMIDVCGKRFSKHRSNGSVCVVKGKDKKY